MLFVILRQSPRIFSLKNTSLIKGRPRFVSIPRRFGEGTAFQQAKDTFFVIFVFLATHSS